MRSVLLLKSITNLQIEECAEIFLKRGANPLDGLRPVVAIVANKGEQFRRLAEKLGKDGVDQLKLKARLGWISAPTYLRRLMNKDTDKRVHQDVVRIDY